MKGILITILMFAFSGCIQKSTYLKKKGCPKYLISLINSKGDVIESRYAHQYHEAINLGANTNFEFRFHKFTPKDTTTTGIWGTVNTRLFEYPKESVVIKRIDVDC
jgi:hypothetical protein